MDKITLGGNSLLKKPEYTPEDLIEMDKMADEFVAAINSQPVEKD